MLSNGIRLSINSLSKYPALLINCCCLIGSIMTFSGGSSIELSSDLSFLLFAIKAYKGFSGPLVFFSFFGFSVRFISTLFVSL